MEVSTWIVVGWFVANALTSVATVGKVRPVVTPGGAVFAQLLYALLVVAALKSADVL